MLGVFSQDFELVKTFPIGDKKGELGIANPKEEDYGGGPGSAFTLVPLSAGWLIHDNVNSSFVLYDRHWNEIFRKNIDYSSTLQIESCNGGLLFWCGVGYGRQFGGSVFWYSKNFKIFKTVKVNLTDFSNSRQNFSFIFRYKDVLIFQNIADRSLGLPGIYFGIKGLATTKDEAQTYLDGKQVRALLADPENTRYKFQGNMILDEGQLVSIGSNELRRYFGNDQVWTHSPFRSPEALANGCYYSLHYPFAVAIRDEHGGALVVKRLLVDPSDTISYSNLFPAPDGYLYQLRGDYAHKETDLYRIGPYPEIKLDYHGKGGTISTDQVNLRESPSLNSDVISQLSKDTPVRILDQTKTPETIAGQTAIWYKVRLWDRTEGWVFGAFLKAVEK
jgi:hypothetical protein